MLCGVAAQYTGKDKCDFVNYDSYQKPLNYAWCDKGTL
jgi:hypothetical protein